MNANPTAPVRQQRLAAGLTQQRLAQLAGCSISYIQLLERGYAPDHSDKLPQVIAALNEIGLGGGTPSPIKTSGAGGGHVSD